VKARNRPRANVEKRDLLISDEVEETENKRKIVNVQYPDFYRNQGALKASPFGGGLEGAS